MDRCADTHLYIYNEVFVRMISGVAWRDLIYVIKHEGEEQRPPAVTNKHTYTHPHLSPLRASGVVLVPPSCAILTVDGPNGST